MLYITVECFMLWIGMCSTIMSVSEGVCMTWLIHQRNGQLAYWLMIWLLAGMIGYTLHELVMIRDRSLSLSGDYFAPADVNAVIVQLFVDWFFIPIFLFFISAKWTTWMAEIMCSFDVFLSVCLSVCLSVSVCAAEQSIKPVKMGVKCQ